jgi:D-alanine-D-alanine ligase
VHIAVLMGDRSAERDVSLVTGEAVAAALERAGHRVTRHDLPDIRAVMDLDLGAVDAVFPALHGGFGEDGHVQALLDILGVPYALSGPLASALAMNKAATKRIMVSAGLPTAPWLLVSWDRVAAAPLALHPGEDGSAGRRSAGAASPALSLERILERALDELGFPLVIKLNRGGSSVGVEIVQQPAQFAGAFERVAGVATGHRTEILLERFVPGRELTATILLGRRLPLVEIRPRQGFYDYANKYTRGASEYLCPAPLESPWYENLAADALRLWDLVGCEGVARVDFRLDGGDHSCLEINTIPGMTDLSLVPMAARAVGISFEALAEDLCLDAIRRRGRPAPERP